MRQKEEGEKEGREERGRLNVRIQLLALDLVHFLPVLVGGATAENNSQYQAHFCRGELVFASSTALDKP